MWKFLRVRVKCDVSGVVDLDKEISLACRA